MTLLLLLLLLLLLVAVVLNVASGQPLVPALFIFGDSNADVGNNNNIYTVVKANFPPYGRDFENHSPTGRFCNGKLTIDFTAEFLGFTTYPPAYLNLKAKGKNLLNGANFASGASGYCDFISRLYNAIPLTKQLDYYKDCQNKLVELAGQSKASSIISDAINLVIAGSSDFLNYYTNALLHSVYTFDQFTDVIMLSYFNFIQNFYALGARRIGVTTLPPMGCLPESITLFGSHSNECVARLNNDAINFNKKLNYTSQNLQKMLPGLNLVVLDTYQPLYDLATKPSENGFVEARKGCCGTGLVEASILCNKLSIGTCANASEYVFWDGLHLSDAANKILARDLVAAGMSLLLY